MECQHVPGTRTRVGPFIFRAVCEAATIATGTDFLQVTQLLRGRASCKSRKPVFSLRYVVILLSLNVKAVVAGLLTASVSGFCDEDRKNVVCPMSHIVFVSSRSRRKLYLGLWYLSHWSHPRDSGLSTATGEQETVFSRGHFWATVKRIPFGIGDTE